jgi:hypothetical protein
MMRALWQRSSPKFGRGNSIEIGEFINADLFVFAGMSVCKEFVENNGRTLVAAHQNGIPIVGLGVGASRYTREDLTPFIKMCREIRNICLITRDELTYSALVSELPNVKRGIDSAFFLPWGFKPTPLNLPKFVVKSFDNMAEPEIHTDLDVIRAHHDLWGPLPRKYVELRRCLVSDVPEDYLNLYSAAEITYSDRVHACVAALAFGNSAQLFGQTPRAQLFAEIGVADISTRPTMADTTLLNDLRVRQINLLKDSYREMVTE